MPEHAPGDTPGHLDIDAVSAYIDRDLHDDDFAVILTHVTQCPDCAREVLEVRTTVFLLNTLPQYEPRRSFCLGHEHARAARRRAAQAAPAWDAGPLPASVAPASAPAAAPPHLVFVAAPPHLVSVATPPHLVYLAPPSPQIASQTIVQVDLASSHRDLN